MDGGKAAHRGVRVRGGLNHGPLIRPDLHGLVSNVPVAAQRRTQRRACTEGTFMKLHILSRVLVSCMLLTISTAPAVASAEGALRVNGAFTVAIDPQSVNAQPVGGTCRISLTATFTFTGDLNGAFTAPFSVLHAGACDQPAREAFQARGTYNGSVAGSSGAFDFLFAGTIDPAGHAQGQLVPLQGTGGLASLRGVVTLEGQSGVGGNYSGIVVLRT